MNVDRSGVTFEKAVASIQARIDPAAAVSHDELLTDRLGQQRQFDVVIRGQFAGQSMLGVIECKDLNRKVGTPEIDGFVTKSSDVNANFKILVSRRGFTKPALAKCKHYGIQPLSLLNDDPANREFFVGTRWEAQLVRWARINVSLHFVQEPQVPVSFNARELTIRNSSVLDWFTNYLLDKEDEISDLGWVVNIGVAFDNPQLVTVRPGEDYLCSSITFMAERVCEHYERLVGVSGSGFFDWNSRVASFPPGSTIQSDGVPLDFSKWQRRPEGPRVPSGFMEIHIAAHSVQFERIQGVLDIGAL
jgi:Restriction endonuclease